MLLRNGAERTLDFVDLNDGESDFVSSVGVRVGSASGDFHFRGIVFNRNPNDGLGTALDVRNNRRMCANGRCQFSRYFWK